MSIIDQIDLSLDKASSLQRKRLEAEESRQKSLNFEIDQLRNQFDGSHEDYENEFTPEKSHSLSQYSPLRNDIKNLELQNQLLASSEKKLKKELDVSDNENDQEILPKYEKQSKSKIPSRKPSEPKTKSKPDVQQRQTKQKTMPKTIPKTTQIVTKVEKREKENVYVIQEQRRDFASLSKHVRNVKETVSNQLTKKEVIKKEVEEEPTYKIRGYRDQAEIKYFGRPLPCNECVFLLNKGMSSDFCSQHGKMQKEKSRQLPNRLAKYF